MNYFKCGIAGWCMEIVFTSLESILSGDTKMMGRTSLLMFPIYGMGALLGPVSRRIDVWIGGEKELTVQDKFWRHGIHDMVLIFCAEYLSGSLLKAGNMCPWDYSGRKFSVDGLIRLDFAPYWFAAGLVFEWLTQRKETAKDSRKKCRFSCK